MISWRHVEPKHDHVIVERLPETPTIVLTDADKYKVCKVLKVGPGRWIDGEFCKTAVKPGDTVLVPGWGGQHPDYEFEKDIFLIQFGDIGAIVG
jgi:co-chaperonin GroES (HSP10)